MIFFPLTNPRAVSTQQQKLMISSAVTNPTVVTTQQKNDDFPATYKPYICFHATEKRLPRKNLTVVPMQTNNYDFLPTYKPYRCSHAAEKTTILLICINPTIVPTQQKTYDFPGLNFLMLDEYIMRVS